MKHAFTLEYWQEGDWYVGKLLEVPGVFSQGEILEQLEKNIEDVYQLIMEEEQQISRPVSWTKEI